MKVFCLSSALTLGITMLAVHVFIGGSMIARPLLDSEIAILPRLTLYLCWHGVTIVLAALALLIADALFWRRRADSAYLVAALASSFALLNLALIAAFGVSPLSQPQWIVFAPMAAAAFHGASALQREK